MDSATMLTDALGPIGTDLFIVAGIGMALWASTYVLRIMWFIVCVLISGGGRH